LSALTFAHPLAALVGLAGIAPVAVALLRLNTGRRVRRRLDLPEPSLHTLLARPIALACLFGLLGLAAARPALRLQHERSMLAASAPGRPERWQRARAFARRLQTELPSVPMGLSSLTNRLLPYLFPTSDPRVYDLVLDEAYGIERPPPALTLDKWVTVFDPLNEVAVRRFFSPRAHTRVLVVLSDAEAHAFDARAVLRHLQRAGTTPVVVRFWRPGERIFHRGSESYRATQPGALATLRRTGWPVFSETQLGAAARFIRAAVGSGSLARVGYAQETTQLGPLLALAAFAPLLLLLLPGAPCRRCAAGGRRSPRRAMVLERFRERQATAASAGLPRAPMLGSPTPGVYELTLNRISDSVRRIVEATPARPVQRRPCRSTKPVNGVCTRIQSRPPRSRRAAAALDRGELLVAHGRAADVDAIRRADRTPGVGDARCPRLQRHPFLLLLA